MGRVSNKREAGKVLRAKLKQDGIEPTRVGRPSCKGKTGNREWGFYVEFKDGIRLCSRCFTVSEASGEVE